MADLFADADFDDEKYDSKTPELLKPKSNLLAIVGALLVGAIAFAGAFFVFQDRTPQAPLHANDQLAIIPLNSQPENTEPEKNVPEKKAPTPPKIDVAKTPAKPTRPLILREITLADSLKSDEPKRNAHQFRSVVVNHDGSRVLTTSESQIICWDTTTGKQQHVFERGDRWKQMVLAAPDAKTVIQMDYAQKAILFFNTENGRFLGQYTVTGRLNHYAEGEFPAFTRDGSELVFVERFDDLSFQASQRHYRMHAVNIRTATGRTLVASIRINADPKDPNKDRNLSILHALPGQSYVLAMARYTNLGDSKENAYSINTSNGEVKRLPWLAYASIYVRYPGHYCEASPDGQRILAKTDSHDYAIGTWPQGTVTPLVEAGGYRYTRDAHWTPDGQRIVRINAWDSNYRSIGIRPPEGYQTNYVELVDVSRNRVLGKRLAHTDLYAGSDDRLTQQLAISGNGKTLVAMGQTRFVLLDFERAFQTAPLPTVPMGKGYVK